MFFIITLFTLIFSNLFIINYFITKTTTNTCNNFTASSLNHRIFI